MKKLFKLILITGFVLSNNLVNANEKKEASSINMVTTSVSGRVIDKITGEALTGVAIRLNNEIIFTDFEGKFEINNILPGEYNLGVSYISYKDIDKNLRVENIAGNSLELEIEPLTK